MPNQNWPGKDFSFYPSMKSGTAIFAVLAFILILGLCIWFAITASSAKFGSFGLSAFVWALTIFIAWAFYSALKPTLSGQASLKVTSEGITSSQWKNKTIAWKDITDIQQEFVQGHEYLSVFLLKNSPSVSATHQWFHGKGLKRQIGLAMLDKQDQQYALPWTQQAWKGFGGQQAQSAMADKDIKTRQLEKFQEDLMRLTPTPWAVYLMIGACLGIWIANIATGMSVIAPTPAQLWSWGGNSASSIKLDGQYWRLLTAAFLHGGVVHLVLNMLGLWSAGKLLNRLHGNLNFLVIYLGSALGGSALSLHFAAQKSISIGASGAVFGVLGALLVAVYQHKDRIPTLFSKDVLTSQGLFLIYALVYGFTQASIDNAAHIGGLITGMALAWILIEKLDPKHASSQAKLLLSLSLLLIGGAVWALTQFVPNSFVNHRQLFAFEESLQKIQPLMQATLQSIERDAKAVQSKTMSEQNLISLIDTKYLPALREIETSLARVRLTSSDPKAVFSQDLQRHFELMRLLMEKQIAISKAQPAEMFELDAQSRVLQNELKQVGARINLFTEQQKTKKR